MWIIKPLLTSFAAWMAAENSARTENKDCSRVPGKLPYMHHLFSGAIFFLHTDCETGLFWFFEKIRNSGKIVIKTTSDFQGYYIEMAFTRTWWYCIMTDNFPLSKALYL